jgi:naphthoate synthase
MDGSLSKNTKISPKKNAMGSRIAFNRPDVRNAFRPKRHQNYTVHSMMQEDTSIGLFCCLLKVLHQKMESTLCSGGDQNARGHQGYVGEDGQHRLNILEVQRLIVLCQRW